MAERIQPTVTNLSTPASFGCEWVDPDSGTTYQLVNPRGTRTLILGSKRDTTWDTITVARPERFMDRIPSTYGEFCLVIKAWFDAAEEPPS